MDTVPVGSIDSVAEALVSLNLQEIVSGIHDEEKFAAQVQVASQQIAAREKQGSAFLEAHEPVPSPPPYLTPPRTQSPVGSVVTSSDRDKLSAGVARLESDPEKASAISELLFTLSKKERLLCVFNSEYLKQKVAEARELLEMDEADVPSSNRSAPAAVERRPPPTPVGEQGIKAASDPSLLFQPPSGANGSAQLSTTAEGATEAPTSTDEQPQQYTLATLGRMPAADIVRLTSSSTV